MKTLLLLLLMIVYVPGAFAQEVIDLQVTGTSTAADTATAKAEIFNAVAEQVSMENIQSLIGKEKTERSRDLIKNKIIKDSGKYILSLQGGQLTKTAEGYSMPVDLKVSLKNLRTLLLQQGLLYQMEGPPKVLPVVRVVDRVSVQSYNWWTEPRGKGRAFAKNAMTSFQEDLRDQLMKIGFYGMIPTAGNLGDSVPDAYRVESPQRGDLLFMGELFKSSIVLKGDIVFRAKPEEEGVYLLDFRLQALQTQNGRVMGEVQRVFETDPGEFHAVVNKKFKEVSPRVAEDMATQLSDAWKRGTFGASLLRLTVESSLPPKDLEEFKRMITLHIREVKAVRERLLEARRTTYEVDSSAPPQQLAQAFKNAQFNQYKVQVESVGQDGITIDVRSK